MRTKKFVSVALLLLAVGVLGGCHHWSSDSYRYSDNYRYRDGSGSYRDGFRDGREYEKRRENWRDDRYADRDYWRRRW
jgi:hypothetical protein